MKVLWFTNILFPEASALLSGEGELKSSGGWMVAAATELVKVPNLELCIAMASSKVRKLTLLKGERIQYFVMPQQKNSAVYRNDYEPFCREIRDTFTPDVVHVHGTENSLGLAYINACGAKNVVVSVQGLISVIADFYNYGLTKWDIFSNLTIRDLVKGNLLTHQKFIKKKGSIEIETLQKVQHVIGRTSWDRAHVWAINPNAHYHFCNETLREEFYTGKWSYENCIPQTIFVSQATYPVKGVHQLFKAMPLILRQYPHTQIRIAGGYSLNGFIQKVIKGTGYSKYLSRLAEKLHIKDHVTYLGPLNAELMKNEYLKANLFVNPSTIENSPNSLGEAQILGVPCISSYVGGTMDMIPNKECGELYRFEDVELLAYKVCEIFEKSKSFDSVEMRHYAFDRHNPSNNTQKLLSIYTTIVGE